MRGRRWRNWNVCSTGCGRRRLDKGQGNSQQRQKGHQQMGAVQDMVGREGGLLDHTESRNEQANTPQPIQPDQQGNNSAVATSDGSARAAGAAQRAG